MNIHAELRAAGGLSAPTVNVQIASVATAVPAHVTGQEEVAERAQKIFPQYARLDSLYKNTGIERRYSVEPKEWYLQPHTWEDRTRSYQRHALDLLERAATQAVAEAGLTLRDIDTIVKQVRYTGWNETQEGDRTVRKELRQVLKKFRLPLTGPLFDNAYGYVRENY